MSMQFKNCSRLQLKYIGWVILFLFASLQVSASYESATVLSDTANGRIEVESESRIDIQNFKGIVDVRVGKGTQIMFAAVSVADRNRELGVEFSSDQTSFYFRPLQSTEEVPTELQIIVPLEMEVEIEGAGIEVKVSSTLGDVSVKGSEIQGTLRSTDNLEIEVETGAFNISDVRGNLEIAGSNLNLQVSSIEGELSFDVEQSEGELESLFGGLTGSLKDSEWVIEDVRGRADIEALGGGVDAAEFLKESVFRMEEAYLRISHSKGDITIDTDDELILEDNEAALHINSFGGRQKIERQIGLIEVVTDSTELEFIDIKGPLRVQGDRLRLNLEQVTSETILILRNSTVNVTGIAAPLEIYNEFGDVFVANASEKLKLKTSDGNVYLSSISGSLDVEADGDTVEVGWASISRETDTVIKNLGGNILLMLPPQGGGLLEAKSGYGRIETDRLDIKVDDDGSSATGIINRQRVPKIIVESEGDIRIEESLGSGG